MKLRFYHVDAFAEKLFSGNPAGVCPLDKWLSDDLLKAIAMENNLSETAFFVKEAEGYHIRWLTPGGLEVNLCGHATLATSHVLFNHEGFTGDEIQYISRSGILKVRKNEDRLTLNFPVDEYERVKTPAELAIALNIQPRECYRGKNDYMVVFEKEEDLKKLKPNFTGLNMSEAVGVICTAKGNSVDYVSRYLIPTGTINEDPATGSAHTTLTPYWSGVLNKKEMTCVQLSERKGYFRCVNLGDRIEISGKARTYLKGEINIEENDTH